MRSIKLILSILMVTLLGLPTLNTHLLAREDLSPSPIISDRALNLKIEIWKNPNCGCCNNWVEHLKQAGFQPTVINSYDMGTIKTRAGIKDQWASCHTAFINGYVIEGHVPAKDLIRFLKIHSNQSKKSSDKILGLAVPGMPSGSPGMENGLFDAYDVLLIKKDGMSEVFASYKTPPADLRGSH